MISTLFFLLLLAFQLWYLASGQAKTQPAGYRAYAAGNPRNARIAGGVLLALAAGAFVFRFGWMTGLSAWLVGLMGVGCLVVALAPFRYFSPVSVAALYIVSLLLELAL